MSTSYPRPGGLSLSTLAALGARTFPPPVPQILGLVLCGRVFSRAEPIDDWTEPYWGGLYLLLRPTPHATRPRTFDVLYAGQAQSLGLRGIRTKDHDGFRRCLEYAPSSQIYIATS